jgi:hypothetical protein
MNHQVNEDKLMFIHNGIHRISRLKTNQHNDHNHLYGGKQQYTKNKRAVLLNTVLTDFKEKHQRCKKLNFSF